MKLRKILSLLVALTLVCSFMTISNVQAAEDEFAILRNLGIMTDFSDDTTPVTRYQLAELAMEMSKISPEPDGEPIYPDIPVKHKYFAVVNAVTNKSLMGALADGSFSPESNATVVDGGRVLLSELGYTAYAVLAGWNDVQYNSKVLSLGIMKGIDTSKPLTKYAFGKMMINMLSTKVMVAESVGTEGVKYEESDLTYIEYKYGYKLKTGVVQANGSASVAGHLAVKTNQIKIDGSIYKTAGYDYTDYVGYKVKYILTSEYDDGQVIHVEKNRGTEELVIEAENIIGYNSYTYTYINEEGTQETVNFAGASVIINGQNMGSYDARYFTPDMGKITLVDTDGDETYDVVKINTAIFFKLGGVTNTSISDKITKKSINVSDADVFVYNKGMTTTLTSLLENTYVEVSAGAVTYDTVNGNEIMEVDDTNAERITISVMNTTKVTGTVSAIKSTAAVIDGKIYDFNRYYLDLLNCNYLDRIVLGSTVEVVLNEKGQIIDVPAVITDYADDTVVRDYAYMINMVADRKDEKRAIVQLVDIYKLEEVRYTTAVDCKLNGKKFNFEDLSAISGQSSATSIYWADGDGFTEFKQQLIKYSLNEAGEIAELFIAKDYVNPMLKKADGTDSTYPNPDYDSSYIGYDNTAFTLDNDKMIMGGDGGVVDKAYTLDKDKTIQILIPANPADITKLDKWKVVINPSRISDDDGTYFGWWGAKYLHIFYDVDDNYVPSVLIMKQDGVTGTENVNTLYDDESRTSIITDINIVLDEDTNEEKIELTVNRPGATELETKYYMAYCADDYNGTGLTNTKFGSYGFDVYWYRASAKPGTKYDNNVYDTAAAYPNGGNGGITIAGLVKWTDLQVGDAIRVSLNDDGKVNGFVRLWHHSLTDDYDRIGTDAMPYGELYYTSVATTNGLKDLNDPMYNNYGHFDLGYVVKALGSEGAIINLDGPTGGVNGMYRIRPLNKAGGTLKVDGGVMIYHTESKKCEFATLNDIKVGDKVISFRASSTSCEVIILRP